MKGRWLSLDQHTISNLLETIACINGFPRSIIPCLFAVQMAFNPINLAFGPRIECCWGLALAIETVICLPGRIVDTHGDGRDGYRDFEVPYESGLWIYLAHADAEYALPVRWDFK